MSNLLISFGYAAAALALFGIGQMFLKATRLSKERRLIFATICFVMGLIGFYIAADGLRVYYS